MKGSGAARWPLAIASVVLGVACTEGASTGVLVLDRVTVVDVVEGGLRPDMRVVLAGDRIDAVLPADEYRIPRGARVHDARGEFVIPGLSDMHVHLDSWDFEHTLPVLVAHGVLTVRDMGGDWLALSAMRERVEAGELIGPRIVLAGEMLDGPTPDWPYRITVRDSSAADGAVLAHKERGVDFIKVHQQLSREAYFAISRAARATGITFAGHVPLTVTGVEAASAGQKSLEHLVGMPPCGSVPASAPVGPGSASVCSNASAQAAIEAFLEHGTWQDPTLAVYDAMLRADERAFSHNERRRYLRPVVEDFWNLQLEVNPPLPPKEQRQALVDGMLANVSALHRAGVRLLTGSDLGFLNLYPGFSLHDELALFVRAGLSPLDALRASSIGPATFFEQEAVWGSVEPGRVADLVVLERNPLEDIENVRAISAVVVRGQLLDKTAIGALLDDAAASAAAAMASRREAM